MRLVTFSVLEVRLLGGPDSVRLTDAESKAMERVHLGGLDALRTDTYRCACKTVDSLCKKGLLAGNGPTDLGRRVGRAVAEGSLV
jgi:hypothetical protein